ncbi:MAG: four-helix bundle copper-binding protein [Pseudonocardiaceae bacterium]|nr:four-helix bundle copper-binding protein [Pseudonocardiaceae bacterium]
MTQAMRMLETHPAQPAKVSSEALTTCIEECMVCAQACQACASACLTESDIQGLARCIRLDLDCADICEATARILTRLTGDGATDVRTVVHACQLICRSCADECQLHADAHQHCEACANACYRCEQACGAVLDELG